MTVSEHPVVLCERSDQGGWRFYCEHCRRWHYHGALAGHRAAHCIKPDSPYKASGYVLALKPYMREMEHAR